MYLSFLVDPFKHPKKGIGKKLGDYKVLTF